MRGGASLLPYVPSSTGLKPHHSISEPGVDSTVTAWPSLADSLTLSFFILDSPFGLSTLPNSDVQIEICHKQAKPKINA